VGQVALGIRDIIGQIFNKENLNQANQNSHNKIPYWLDFNFL